MSRCRKCLLPSQVPGSDFDQHQVCVFCRTPQENHLAPWDDQRLQSEKDLNDTLKNLPKTGSYDAVVCLSGGKDSLYLMHKLKVEYGLRLLALTTDINIPAAAWDNIKRAVKVLDIDHLVYRPSDEFYRKLFRYVLQHQEERGAVYSLSYVYAPLFETDALRLATEKKIPLIFAGYSPGQPEPQRMIYEFSRKMIYETDWTPPELARCGAFSADELARFWNPRHYPAGTMFPRYIAPLHAWPYNQEEIMKKVVELGLAGKPKNANPIYSNYPIQWLLMYSDLVNLGYNPYAPEFCSLIREGKASLSTWKWLAPWIDFMIRHKILLGEAAKDSAAWLGLKDRDLKITLPYGAYDPPLSGE